ncbi:MAG: hydantoinase/oxoprolinase family protein [Planctomycetota bacterium]
MSPKVVAVDIGGANLKYADASDFSFVVPFEMWRCWAGLTDQLIVDLQRFGRVGTLLVTMTGELADCFSDRHHGVTEIVAAVQQTGIAEVRYYAMPDENIPSNKSSSGDFGNANHRWLSADQASRHFMSLAASNWHASALSLSAKCTRSTLLVDIGSTTTDVIPLGPEGIETDARDDTARLADGTLLYLGDDRTPVFGWVGELIDRGTTVPTIPEWFATMSDVRLLLGHEPENPDDVRTANGQGRTIHAAAARLLRVIGRDLRDRNIGDARDLAAQCHRQARQRIVTAINRFPNRQIVFAGAAEDLLPGDRGIQPAFAPEYARCAPCHAMLQLFGATG